MNLDGLLDEVDWRQPGEDRLIQNDPDNGCAPRHRTEFWVAYDDEALYVAARMFDSAPDSIAARKTNRPIRPKPLIPTLTVIDISLTYLNCCAPSVSVSGHYA